MDKDDDIIICKKCFSKNGASRKTCWNCGAELDNEKKDLKFHEPKYKKELYREIFNCRSTYYCNINIIRHSNI